MKPVSIAHEDEIVYEECRKPAQAYSMRQNG